MTQDQALTLLKMGKNVFLTGSAGSGKTYVLNAYIDYLKKHGVGVAVTASTGIAATHMQGMTIHAWSGIGVREVMTPYDIDFLEQKQYLWARYNKTKVLIIDEVSMLSGQYLDMVDAVCRAFKREPDLPFGGIQVVLSGDLFQLPPVSKDRTAKLISDAAAWSQAGLVMCYLTEQHRQDDSLFLDFLNAIRSGELDDTHYELLGDRMVENKEDLDPDITQLFTHNVDVDAINMGRLEQINGESYSFLMEEKGKENLALTLKRGCLALEELILKEGAQVLFIKNNPEAGYVNGTRGVVVGFSDDSDHLPIVETTTGESIVVNPEVWSVEDDGKVKASIEQIPLRLAWAITIHKSQGMSLDKAIIDLSRAFSHGMGYVALSRVRTLNGLHLLGINPQAFFMEDKVRGLDKRFQSISEKAANFLDSLERSEIAETCKECLLAMGGVLEEKEESTTKKSGTKNARSTKEETLVLITEGKTVAETAEIRGMTIGTILTHLEELKEIGYDVAFDHIMPAKAICSKIEKAFKETSETKLAPVKKYLEEKGFTCDFDTIRLARLGIAEK